MCVLYEYACVYMCNLVILSAINFITPLRTLVFRFIITFIYCDQYCTGTIYSAMCSARGTHHYYLFMYSRISNQSINQSINVFLVLHVDNVMQISH